MSRAAWRARSGPRCRNRAADSRWQSFEPLRFQHRDDEIDEKRGGRDAGERIDPAHLLTRRRSSANTRPIVTTLSAATRARNTTSIAILHVRGTPAAAAGAPGPVLTSLK